MLFLEPQRLAFLTWSSPNAKGESKQKETEPAVSQNPTPCWRVRRDAARRIVPGVCGLASRSHWQWGRPGQQRASSLGLLTCRRRSGCRGGPNPGQRQELKPNQESDKEVATKPLSKQGAQASPSFNVSEPIPQTPKHHKINQSMNRASYQPHLWVGAALAGSPGLASPTVWMPCLRRAWESQGR